MHNSVLGTWYLVVYYVKGPTVTDVYIYIFYELANKNFLVVVFTTPMFQLLKGHYQ